MSDPQLHLPSTLAAEVRTILRAKGLAPAPCSLRASYQALPGSPPNRRAGLVDVYLLSPATATENPAAENSSDSERHTDAGYGFLLVHLAITVCLPPSIDIPDTHQHASRIRDVIRGVAAGLNERWVAEIHPAECGRPAPRYQIHVHPEIHVAGQEDSEGPFGPLLPPEGEEAGPPNFFIHLSRAANPEIRWKTEAALADLRTGHDFESAIPPGARDRIVIQHLKKRIDAFQACNPHRLSERYTRIREILTGARAFQEINGEVGEDWAEHSALCHGEFQSERNEIEEGIRQFREMDQADLAERLDALARLKAACARFPTADSLQRGWRASPYTEEIDAAVIACVDLPPTACVERMEALDLLQTRCAAFVQRTRTRSRFWHRSLHRLIPQVEALALRARKTRAEVALNRAMARLVESIESKEEELGVLAAARALAGRARRVRKDVESAMSSVDLVVEYGDDDDPVTALDNALQAQLPALLNIEKPINALRGEDLLPLARRVLPPEIDVVQLP